MILDLQTVESCPDGRSLFKESVMPKDIEAIALLIARFVFLYIKEILFFLKECFCMGKSEKKTNTTTIVDSSESEYWWYQDHGDPMHIYPEDEEDR